MSDATNSTLAILWIVLYCISWPIVKLVQGLALVLSPFWSLAQFVLLPVTYLLHGILSVLLFPFRIQLLEKIETIYIYLGIAGLIGCITGGILYLCFNFISSSLSIDTIAEAKSREKGRTTAAYRAERRRKKEQSFGYLPSPTLTKKGLEAPKQRGLLSQTIIEEEDSDF